MGVTWELHGRKRVAMLNEISEYGKDSNVIIFVLIYVIIRVSPQVFFLATLI